MATDSWSSGAPHTSDAEFRAWGSELSAKLQAIGGLVQTADTGQINWLTVTRPGTNTDGGYEIYYLDDSLHGTAPVYFKLYYGTGSNAAYPRLRIEVGTGSNGSGTITGTALMSVRQCHISGAVIGATARSSYLCVNEGFVGLLWKTGASAEGGFFLCRTCDPDGTPNDKGLASSYVSTSGNFTTMPLRFESPAAAYTAGVDVTFTPVGMTSGAIGSDLQVMTCWMATPDVRPIFGHCMTWDVDYSTGTTFTATLVGPTARTYISGADCTDYGNNSSLSIAMLWE